MPDPLCHLCPYSREGQQRVRGTDLERDRIVVGMAPGVEEAMQRTPFVGPPGAVIREFLDGTPAGFTNAVECFPGQQVNMAHYRAASECCKPRLTAELAGKDVLVLGNEAMSVVNGKKSGITAFRGTVTEGDLGTRRATYSLHPSFVLRSGGASSTPGVQLRNDVKQWLHGKKPRPEIEILINPKRLKLPPKGTTVVVDIETAGLDPREGSPLAPEERPDDVGEEPRIRCYGFAWRELSPDCRDDGDDRRLLVGGTESIGQDVRDRCVRGNLRVAVFSECNATVRRLLDGRYPLVAQNHAFEVKWLTAHGPIPVFKGQEYKRENHYDLLDWSDTMLSAHALHEDRGGAGDDEEESRGVKPGYRLDGLAEDFLEWSFPKDEMLAPYNVLTAPLDVLMPYCGWDCIKELMLHERWREELRVSVHPSPIETTGLVSDVRTAVSARLEHLALPGLRFLDRVTDRGMPWDERAADGVLAELEEREDTLGSWLNENFGERNWNSDPQLREFFKAAKLKASGIRTDTGEHSLARLAWSGIRHKNPDWKPLIDALIGERYPAIKPLEGYRGALKMKSDVDTFRRTVGTDGRVHGRLSITGTATGRLSASNPPLHNVAPALRRCFYAPRGYTFLAMDVAGSEVSWQAHVSGDPELERIARERISLHDVVAKMLDIPRPVAKSLNFADQYGGGGPAINRGMSLSHWGQFTDEECRQLSARKKAMFPRYQEWSREVEAFVAAHGYVVTDFGWVRRLPAATGQPFGSEYHRALRQAVNTMSQNPSSDAVLYRAMEMEEELGLEIVLLKHDEILALVKKRSARKVAREMQRIFSRREFYWGDVRVPLFVDFEVGECWGRMAPLEVT